MLLYDLQMRPHHFLLLGGVSTYGLLEHNGIGLPRVTKSIAAKELVKIIVYVPSTDKLSKCHHSIDNDFTLKSSTMYISNELNRDHCLISSSINQLTHTRENIYSTPKPTPCRFVTKKIRSTERNKFDE